jgi:tetraacyldisaccharide 4'-kinase
MNGRWIRRRIWQRRGVWGIFLRVLFLPVACLYWLGVQIRNGCYSFGWKKSRRLAQFVISIGNLTVGGTGKTPTVVWMAQELRQRGFKTAVLSRGYHRKGNQPRMVNPSLSAKVDDFGDEPAMMAQIFGLTVAVGSPRYLAADQVIEQGAVDVFLLDDGFQHRQLARDVDLLLLGSDAEGWMLPSGPFREPKTALGRADFLLITGARERWQRVTTAKKAPSAVFYGSLQPQALIALESHRWQEYSVSRLARRKILAVAAIADPEPFYRMIELSDGEIVDVLEFPDHHDYSLEDGQRIARAARNADLIVTTEKDILKLIRFPLAQKLLALRVAMIVESGASLVQSIVERIQEKQTRHLVGG